MFASSCRTLAAAIKASPMPVLPEVGSTSVVLPVRMELVNMGLVCNQRQAAVWQLCPYQAFRWRQQWKLTPAQQRCTLSGSGQ